MFYQFSNNLFVFNLAHYSTIYKYVCIRMYVYKEKFYFFILFYFQDKIESYKKNLYLYVTMIRMSRMNTTCNYIYSSYQ